MLEYVIAYLYGAIPFGYLLAKLKNIDITKVGSGNIGTANVLRTLGIFYGILTFILDFSKGVLAYLLSSFGANPFILELLSLLGNIHSPFLKFKGGKGFANLAGFLTVYLFSNNINLFLFLFTNYLALLILTGITSLANLMLVLNLNLATIFFDNFNIFYAIFALIIFYSHRGNIKRLLKREERITIKWK